MRNTKKMLQGFSANFKNSSFDDELETWLQKNNLNVNAVTDALQIREITSLKKLLTYTHLDIENLWHRLNVEKPNFETRNNLFYNIALENARNIKDSEKQETKIDDVELFYKWVIQYDLTEYYFDFYENDDKMSLYCLLDTKTNKRNDAWFFQNKKWMDESVKQDINKIQKAIIVTNENILIKWLMSLPKIEGMDKNTRLTLETLSLSFFQQPVNDRKKRLTWNISSLYEFKNEDFTNEKETFEHLLKQYINNERSDFHDSNFALIQIFVKGLTDNIEALVSNDNLLHSTINKTWKMLNIRTLGGNHGFAQVR